LIVDEASAFLLQAKLASFHYCCTVDNNRRALDHPIDMRSGVPIGAGLTGTRAAERDVNTGELFVLENIVDQLGQARVRTDGELAYSVAVLVVLEKVFGELLAELLVGAFDAALYRSGVLDFDGNWRIFEKTIFLSKDIAQTPG
jgi:hypothetical protein